MNKKDLLQKIDKMSISEEQAMPIYSKHMSVIMGWSSLTEEKRRVAAEILNTLRRESEGHLAQLRELSRYITESGKHVF